MVEDVLPLVSVGMPAYNSERWIRSAIESILQQDYTALELIISDNASTDATEAICREIAATDPRVRYFRNVRNLGVDANYNRVVELANGHYFKWAASNDLCAPAFIGACVRVLEARPDVVLACPRVEFIVDDEGTREPYARTLSLEDESPCIRLQRCLSEVRLGNVLNGVIRMATLRRTRLLRFHHGSDTVLIADLSMRGKFVDVPEYLFYRRMTPESATGLMSKAEVNAYFAPDLGGASLVFQKWKLAASYTKVVYGAPVELCERLCLHLILAKFIWWMRHEMLSDFWQSVKVLVARCVTFRSQR